MIFTLGMALALGNGVYLLMALYALLTFRQTRSAPTYVQPPVTILVPVCGAPPDLYECLCSCCDQDYPQYQVVFGLHRADDPGKAIIERVMAERPGLDVQMEINATRIGDNPKVCNLANLYASVKHEIIVMLDSDVIVDRHFLSTIVEPFHHPAIGGVTCIYQGRPNNSFASRLGALFINAWYLPSALVDVRLHEMKICYGAAMAVTRQSLQAIGGFSALASAVAEDDVLGELLYRAGYHIALAPYLVTTLVTETDLPTLWQRELRWFRSIRACRPWAHRLSLVMHPLLPVSVILLGHPTPMGLSVLGILLLLRFCLHRLVQRQTRIVFPFWLMLLRECLTVGMWMASFLSWTMTWQGSTLRATGKRRMSVHP